MAQLVIEAGKCSKLPARDLMCAEAEKGLGGAVDELHFQRVIYGKDSGGYGV